MAVAAGTGCKTLRRAERADQENEAPRPGPIVTPMPGGSGASNPIVIPEGVPSAPIATPPPVQVKVGVILSPGGMKTFAQLGVLREMARARIPVHAIVGMEWGAVMAGAFASSAQINDAEWKAFKLKENELPAAGFLTRKLDPAGVSALRGFLDSAFGSATVEKSKVRFACPATKATEKGYQLGRGRIQDVVAKCLPYPPLYRENEGWFASPFAVEDSAAWLRSQGANVILLVNVLGPGGILPGVSANDSTAENVLWNEIRREMLRAKAPIVNHVITVNTQAHSISDFDGRRSLMDAGQKSATEVLNKMVSQYGF